MSGDLSLGARRGRRVLATILIWGCAAGAIKGCVSINLFRSEAETRTIFRSDAQRHVIELRRAVDAFETPPWAGEEEEAEPRGLAVFISDVLRAFRDEPQRASDVSAGTAAAAALAGSPGGCAEARRLLAADQESLEALVARVDAARQSLGEDWTLVETTELLNQVERLITFSIARAEGAGDFTDALRDGADCAPDAFEGAVAAYEEAVSLLRADAEAIAAVIQRKSASISSWEASPSAGGAVSPLFIMRSTSS